MRTFEYGLLIVLLAVGVIIGASTLASSVSSAMDRSASLLERH